MSGTDPAYGAIFAYAHATRYPELIERTLLCAATAGTSAALKWTSETSVRRHSSLRCPHLCWQCCRFVRM
eukprot:718927-Rhodomonas_salina.1